MRKVMLFSIGFAAACAVGAYFYLPFFHLLALLALLICGLCFVISTKIRDFRIPGMIFCGLAVGFVWFFLYETFYVSSARAMDGQTATATVTASDFGYSTDYGISVDGKVVLDGKSYSVRAYLNGEDSIKPGDQITGEFRIRFTALGGLEEPNYLRSEGIYLILYPKGEHEILRADAVPKRFMPALWRQKLTGILHTAFPEDTVGIATALLLGERSGVDYETATALKVSGITHIIAVSGLHVSILFGLVYALTGRKRYLTGIIGIPLLIAFAAVAGFTPSITRACIMQILVLIAMMTNREYDPPTSLAFAVLCMTAVNPLVVISISFQLSVGCMAGIFLFSERIRNWLADPKRFGSDKGSGIFPRLKRWLFSSFSVSLSSAVFTTPLVALYFGCVSLVSVLTNLMVLWIVTYVFYGILFVCVLGMISMPVASFIASIVAWGIRYIVTAAKLLSKFPLAAVYTKSIYIVIWLVFCYILLAVYICMRKKPALLFSCAAVTMLCICLLASWSEPLMDGSRMTVLDVGQGQCILLQSEGKTYMVDCGGDSDEKAADMAAETLLSMGIYKLDGLIVTHYDRDHAGGVPNFLSRISAQTVFLPDVEDEEGIGSDIAACGDNVVYVREDLLLTYGAAEMTIFGPQIRQNGNESSLCILFRRENCDILITGDRGELGEMLLLRTGKLTDVDVLIAGHHGASGSTGEALLAKTTPEIVMISVGRNNRYKHPSDKLLERLASFNCTVYRTDLHGTIIYRR